MKRILIAGVICLTAASHSLAADLPQAPPPAPRAPVAYLPPAPVYNWSGFYIGLNGGWGFASGNSTATITSGPFAGSQATGSGSLNGGIAGGQIGANYQIDALVLGIEGDFDWSGQSVPTPWFAAPADSARQSSSPGSRRFEVALATRSIASSFTGQVVSPLPMPQTT